MGCALPVNSLAGGWVLGELGLRKESAPEAACRGPDASNHQAQGCSEQRLERTAAGSPRSATRTEV